MRFRLPFPQLMITLFVAVMMVVAGFSSIPLGFVIEDSLVRLVMNGFLVMSLLPMINAGVGINFGLPVGIAAGLMGMCLAVNFRLKGGTGFFCAMLFSVPVSVLLGYLYARILNRTKGQEEITGTFIGFAIVYLLSLFWATAPFTNPAMLWPIGGKGMRPTIGLRPYFEKVLNNLWVIDVAGVRVPAGLLLFFLGFCILFYLFFRTRTGIAMKAVGENEIFARLSGVDVSKIRTTAVILSTLMAAWGICVYAQSYGFIELYDAPLMMAFPAASAILIGGAGSGRASVLHVVAGTWLFQTTYILSAPIANEMLLPEVAEIFRTIVTNGVILYALLHRRGKSSHETP